MKFKEISILLKLDFIIGINFTYFRFITFIEILKRHQDILYRLSKEKHFEVRDLCEFLNVSAVTIRKDLNFENREGC
jgi:hypothetical protein